MHTKQGMYGRADKHIGQRLPGTELCFVWGNAFILANSVCSALYKAQCNKELTICYFIIHPTNNATLASAKQ